MKRCLVIYATCFNFSGDILLFLTGQEEIEATVRAIKDIAQTLPQHCAAIYPCPMYANMPAGQQLKIFRPTLEVSRTAADPRSR